MVADAGEIRPVLAQIPQTIDSKQVAKNVQRLLTNGSGGVKSSLFPQMLWASSPKIQYIVVLSQFHGFSR
jgi:hypothetical protein